MYKSFNRILSKQQIKPQKKACERYQYLSEGEKIKQRQYGRERYRSLFEHDKERLVKYRKSYSKSIKN